MGKDNGPGAVITAFLLGAFTGAAIALLWAPATGRETRELLGEKVREGKDRAGDLAGRAKEVLARQKQHLQDAVERGRQAYREAREQGEA